MEKISVFIINYNGKRTVLQTIESIRSMERVDVTIDVIDDHSTDDSPDMIRSAYPDIPVYALPFNTARLNFLRNLALRLAHTPKLLITDNDVLFDSLCLSELLKVMEQDESIATCTPRLMYWDEPKRVYVAGTRVHYIGVATGGRRGEVPTYIDPTPTPNSGGGILLLDRSKALKAGGFDEDYKMGWGDDGEFYQRLMLAGHKCLYVPSAFARHECKPFTSLRTYRAVNQIYNRWQFILTHYSTKTIFLLIPALLLYEVFQFLFLARKGMTDIYFTGNTMAIKSIPLFLKKRKVIKVLRVVSDRDLLSSGAMFVSPSLLQSNRLMELALKGANGFFNLYWKSIKVFI
jgi:GT2 family glycosyltransferase